MSDSLINVPKQDQVQDDAFDAIVTSAGYLQRLQLYTGNSRLCKIGAIQQGIYGLPAQGDKAEPVGNELDVVPIMYRAKAVDTSGKTPISNYDSKSATFKDIEKRSFTKDSGCMYGIEYLLWYPDKKMFITFFFSSISSRPVAKELQPFIEKAATFTVGLVDKKYTYHVPEVKACDRVISVLPTPEELEAAVEKYTSQDGDELASAEGPVEDDGR